MKKILPSLFITYFIFLSFGLLALEMNEEELIKGRKALFKQNYGIAKKMSSEINTGNISSVSELAIKMGENYSKLINYFPENTKEGFNTEALPSIWENKDEFNALMQNASDDMIKLAKAIETAEDLRAAEKELMWCNCTAFHSRFRAPH